MTWTRKSQQNPSDSQSKAPRGVLDKQTWCFQSVLQAEFIFSPYSWTGLETVQSCSTSTSQEHSSHESRECECTCVVLIVHTVCIAYSLPLIKKRQTWRQHPVGLVFIKAKNNSNISTIITIISLSAEFCRHLLGSVWQASYAWVCVCGSGIQGFLLKPPVWLSLPPNSTSSAKNSYSVAATRKTN